MILGIEASNIRAGGGLTHLTELISNIEQQEIGFDKVIIWGSTSTLDKLPEMEWLVKKSNKMIDKSFLTALIWQILFFRREARKLNCSLAFAPGSTFLSGFRPYVTMSQNMLPFELKELFRFKGWVTRLRFLVLYLTQSYTFKNAGGLIFLTNYAKEYISKSIRIDTGKTTIIPHGINTFFFNQPKEQRAINTYSEKNPYRLLYVSIVTVYKHQWNVAKAVSELRRKGYPVVLDLVGPSTEEGFALLSPVMKSEDPDQKFIFYHGMANREQLKVFYQQADAFVFASSCENMPIILIEAITAGLPIACSERRPMSEVLKKNGFYFNPENVDSITDALILLCENPDLRSQMSSNTINEVKGYTWRVCAQNTFNYLYKFSGVH
ncbi:MAG: glycosyltransferase family 4 protein [Mangrovibacterium sp.]